MLTGDKRRAWLASIERSIWSAPLADLSPWRARQVRFTRLLLVLARDLLSEQLTLRAMSLVYTTLLSIVPLLALSFSVLKAFGVYHQTEPALRTFLTPLGEKAEEVSGRIIQFIDNVNVGVLGSVGLALLLYTAVSLVQKLEEAFNHIWHVAEPRAMGERFSRYLSVLLVGPILVFAAVGITATVMNLRLVQSVLAMQPFGELAFFAGKVMPYLLVIAAFTFLYMFVPNTRVRLRTALLGGIVGGILWQSAGWAFALFVAAAGTYSAIYSSFAILVLFMIWLYLSWLILLFGASVAFYAQHREYVLAAGGEPRLSNRMRERLALAIMTLIAEHYRRGTGGWTSERLSQVLQVPRHAVQTVLNALRSAGFLAPIQQEPPAYMPARDLRTVSVAQLLEAVRRADEERSLNPEVLAVPESVDAAMERVERSIDEALGGLSVEELAAQSQPVAVAGSPPAGT